MSKPFVLILTATATEYEVAKEWVGTVRNQNYRERPGRRQVFTIECPTTTIVVEKLPDMGNIASAKTTAALIGRYRPICVIGVGICGSDRVESPVKQRDFGDLVVGTEVSYFESAKLLPNETDWRPKHFNSTISLEQLPAIALPSASQFAQFHPPGRSKLAPQLICSSYACGEKVVADEKRTGEFLAVIRRHHGEAPAAIEMESAGIASACSDSFTKFVMLKGISDFANEQKDDHYQRFAAAVSISTAVQWVESFTARDVDLLYIPVGFPNEPGRLVRATQAGTLAGAMLPTRGVEGRTIEQRGVDDLITRYDRLTEQFLSQVLCDAGDRFIGEETPETNENNVVLTDAPTWIVDPVDGTQNIAAGLPEVAVSIALYEHQQPSLAVINLPYRAMTVCRAKGQRLEVNGVEWISYRSVPERLEDAVVAIAGDVRRVGGRKTADIFRALSGRVASIRITGALAYDLACLALGEIDVRISRNAKLVDVAAGVLMVREKGGRVTDFSGNEWTPRSTSIVAAASKALHAEAMQALESLPSDRVRLAQYGYLSEWALAQFFPALFDHGLDQRFQLVRICGEEADRAQAIAALQREIQQRDDQPKQAGGWRSEQTKTEQESCRQLLNLLNTDQLEYCHHSRMTLDQIDAGVIHSTNRTHLTHIETLIRHQKHLLCEKPLVVVTDDAHRADAAPLNALKCLVQPNQTNLVRMDAEHYSAKTAARLFYDNLDEMVQTHGKIAAVKGCSLELDDPAKARTQRVLSRENRTGLLLDMGVHYLGIITNAGGWIVDIDNCEYDLFPGYEVETYVHTEFTISGKRFKPKAKAELTIAKFGDRFALNPIGDETKKTEITFEDSTTIVIDFIKKALTDQSGTPLTQYETQATEHEYVNILHNFHRAIHGGAVPVTPFESSLEYLRAIFQMYEKFPVKKCHPGIYK